VPAILSLLLLLVVRCISLLGCWVVISWFENVSLDLTHESEWQGQYSAAACVRARGKKQQATSTIGSRSRSNAPRTIDHSVASCSSITTCDSQSINRVST